MSAQIIQFPDRLAQYPNAGASLGVDARGFLGRYGEKGFHCMPFVSTVHTPMGTFTRVRCDGHPTRHYAGELHSEDVVRDRYVPDVLGYLRKKD